jgi:hypothetical protein
MLKRQQIARPGRFKVIVECADNLSDDEIIHMQAAVEAQVCLLQKQKRGYTQDYVTAALAA